MADAKISELSELSETPASDDEFVIVDKSDTSMAASGTNKKITHENMITSDGWYPANETWTYASSSTFTISGDVTDKYFKGVKVKLTNDSATKYFYIAMSEYSSPNTTITIVVNTSYSLASGAISSPYYSYMEMPQGFPAWKYVCAKAYLTGDQASVSSGDKINLNTVRYNIGGHFDKDTNYEFATPISAFYSIIGNIRYGSLADTKYYGAEIWVNGSIVAYSQPFMGDSGFAPSQVVAYEYVTSGQDIELHARTEDTKTVDEGEEDTWMAVKFDHI